MKQGRFTIIVAAIVLSGCSDGATRVAYDIESGMGKLGSTEGARAEIRHTPRAWPAGCDGAYTLRIGRGSAINEGLGNFRTVTDSESLQVRCGPQPGNTNGWHTTYHLRFVQVPASVEVTKNAGETTVIDVQRLSGKAIVVGLR